jgi:hypothetical protein
MAARKPGPITDAEREVVTQLLDTKAVNFEAIGAAFAKFGPTAALRLEGEDVFCGTMKRFVRVFRLRDELAELENIAQLRQLSGELRG